MQTFHHVKCIVYNGSYVTKQVVIKYLENNYTLILYCILDGAPTHWESNNAGHPRKNTEIITGIKKNTNKAKQYQNKITVEKTNKQLHRNVK